MSGTIWLIVEDESDADIVKAILQARKIAVDVRVKPPPGGSGGVGKLANNLEVLIKDALDEKQAQDCIAVLHDADLQQNENRAPYDKIRTICQSDAYRNHVKLIVAHDEIESWLLSDNGVCRWLAEKPRNCDELRKPKDTLNSKLKSAGKKQYSGRGRTEVLKHIDGSGDQHSQSMKAALRHLQDAPCLR